MSEDKKKNDNLDHEGLDKQNTEVKNQENTTSYESRIANNNVGSDSEQTPDESIQVEENKDEAVNLEQKKIDGNNIINNSEEIKEETITKNTNSKTKKGNTKYIIGMAVVGILCLGAGFISGKQVGRTLPATSKSYSSSKVMATVGDVKITGEDLQKKMDPLFYLNGKDTMTDDQIAAYESSMMDYMTTTEVLYLEAKSKKVTVSKEDIDEEYEAIMSGITQKFGITEDEFLKEFNLTKEYVRENVEKELIAAKYIGDESDVSEDEAKNYFEKNKEEFKQVQASHILIKNVDDEGNAVSDSQKEKNKKKAEEILAKAKAGEDFAALAKEYSEDTSASTGGDLGYFGKGQMVEPFEKAAYALKVGEISSEIVETDYGYHIIKKTAEQDEDFDTISEDLVYTLSYEKQNNILDNLIEKYKIDIK